VLEACSSVLLSCLFWKESRKKEDDKMSWPQQPYYGGAASGVYTQQQLAAIAQQQQQQQSQYYAQQQQQYAAMAQQQQQQQYAAAYGQYAQQQQAAAYGQYPQQQAAAYPQQQASSYSGSYPTYQSAPSATDWGYYQQQAQAQAQPQQQVQPQPQPQAQVQQQPATQMGYQTPLTASTTLHQSQLLNSQQLQQLQQPQQPQQQQVAAGYPYPQASVNASYAYPAQTPSPPVQHQQQQQVTPPTKAMGYSSGHYYTPPTGHYSVGAYPGYATPQVVYSGSQAAMGRSSSSLNRKSQPPMHVQQVMHPGIYSTPGMLQPQARYASFYTPPAYAPRPYSPWAVAYPGAYPGGGVCGGASPCGAAGGNGGDVCRRPGSMMPAKRSEKEAPTLDKEEAERERLAKLEADGGLFSKISQAAAKIG